MMNSLVSMHDFSREGFLSIERWVVWPWEMTGSNYYVVEYFCSLFTIRLADNGEIVFIFVEGYIFYCCRVFELVPDVVLFNVV